MDLLVWVLRRATNIDRWLELLLYEKSLRRLRLFSLENRRCGDCIVGFQYLKGAYKKDGEKKISRAFCYRTRGNSFELKIDLD